MVIVNSTFKKCVKCNQDKSINDFYKYKKSKDGYQSWCKECYKEYDKNKYNTNKEHILKKHRKWLKNNKQQIRQTESIYRKTRQEKDPCFKLLLNLRSRINVALLRNTKADSTIRLLGCSIEQLKFHLETQFKPGMNWKNHTVNGWHIDHIVPCSKFDLSDPKEQRKCFNYTNLQPLWAEENLVKSNA